MGLGALTWHPKFTLLAVGRVKRWKALHRKFRMSPILALGSEGSAGSGLRQVESNNIPLVQNQKDSRPLRFDPGGPVGREAL